MPKEQLLLGMFHDFTEIKTNDMPSPVQYFLKTFLPSYGFDLQLARLNTNYNEDGNILS